MHNILVIHNSNMTNAEFKSQLSKKVPSVKTPKGLWNLVITRVGKKFPQDTYTRIYYDIDTVTQAEVAKYIADLPYSVDIIGVSILGKKGGFRISNYNKKDTK